ncbi:uncharacterized protein [Fopius arisanus]|uniref:Odorant receptor n=1 Tax=Fopius arisanus TaxID=64838 RepID=A0A9R1U0T7_9HYME|nr:PREDICTED: uncharacterized protein LOC105266486 [Fopius arisanus]
MDASLAAELERVKSLLDRAVWPLSITGIWPKNVTTYTRRKSSFILTYFMFHLFLELLDLVSVCGNVELMVLNLVETGFLTMAMYRLLIIRFHKTLPKLIDSREKYMVVENFNNSEELKIYLGHASVVEKFYRWWNVYATGTAFMYYIMPLPTYLVKRMVNDETAILINPYRIYHFINLSSIPRTAFLYVYQFPIILMVASYFTSAVISLAFVTNFCGQIAVLARRIMTMTDDNTDPRHIFHRHTKQHIKILM